MTIGITFEAGPRISLHRDPLSGSLLLTYERSDPSDAFCVEISDSEAQTLEKLLHLITEKP